MLYPIIFLRHYTIFSLINYDRSKICIISTYLYQNTASFMKLKMFLKKCTSSFSFKTFCIKSPIKAKNDYRIDWRNIGLNSNSREDNGNVCFKNKVRTFYERSLRHHHHIALNSTWFSTLQWRTRK